MQCDFCKSSKLTKVYVVPTSLINAIIYSCDDCGLLQSIYGDKTNKHTHKSISSGADWGNIRHGKKIRLNSSINVLKDNLDLEKIKHILDIGSNRGHFVNYILDNTDSYIDAVEPDSRILDNYKNSINLRLYNERFENIFFDKCYDLIYCCHTLEHVDSASFVLTKMVNLLSNNGYLFIDVPSARILNKKDNVEEFFIDKHTYHFNEELLINYIKALGIDIIYSNDDDYNIVLIGKKTNKSLINYQLINDYKNTLKYNHNMLCSIVDKIHLLCQTDDVTLYGASKIYDALVTHGKLDVTKIKYVVDDYLYGYIDKAHKKELTDSQLINSTNTNTVILLTRSATPKLIEELNKKNIKNIITFNQLLNI